MSTVEELKEELHELRKQHEDLEVAKNVEISSLKERVADLSFQLQLLPVEQMASQTPYSKKNLDGLVKSPAAASLSCDEDIAMSQELVESDRIEPSASAYLCGLSNMQSYVQQLQHAIAQQRLLHERDQLVSQPRSVIDIETNEELDALKERVKQLEAQLADSENNRTTIGANFNKAVADFNAKERILQDEVKVKSALLEQLRAQVPSEMSQENSRIEKDELGKKLEDAVALTETLRGELTAQAEAHADLEATFQEMQKKQEATIMKLEAEKGEALAELENVEAEHAKEMEVRELAIAAMQTAHTAVSDRVKELEAMLAAADDMRDKLQEAEQNLKNEEASARASRDKAERLSIALDEKRKEHEEAIDKLQKLESSKRKVEDARVQALEDENATLEERCQELQGEVSALKKELAEQPAKATRNGSARGRSTDGSSPSKKRKIQKEIIPSITLSGFREAAQKKEIVSAIDTLGGELVKMTADTFDKNCSHIVIPNHEARTVKTVAAVLTGKWVMTMLWAIDSKKAGKWLDEDQYGYRLTHEGIQGMNVFLTKDFKSTSGADRVKQAEQLVEYGGATLTDSITKADIVLRASNESDKTRKKMKFNNTWESFIAWIFPTDWRPACTLE